MPDREVATPNAEHLYALLLEQLKRDLGGAASSLRLVGIHSGGVWIAKRLHRDLGLSAAPGTLDISFYRDDFHRIGLHPQVKPTAIPFEVEGASLLLVDDVLYTGRTIRGAMNVLFDYGRPARIDLAVLIDRGGRELPIDARWAGARVSLPAGRDFVLAEDEAGQFRFEIEH